jgi:hypothetical protein
MLFLREGFRLSVCLSSLEVKRKMDEQSDQPEESREIDRLGDLFALGTILSMAIKNSNYQLSETASATLQLNRYGLDVYNIIKEKYTSADDGLIKLALFCENYWKEMFFDHLKTNINYLVTDISNGLIANSLRLPFSYCGVLYRKANELFSEIKNTLDPAETSSLLAGTPQGVFQMRSYVSGPLGLLASRQKRDHRPTRGVPLFAAAPVFWTVG